MPTPPAGPAPGEVHVHYAHVASLLSSADQVDRWRGWLSPDEQSRFHRFRHDDDRFMFLAGRAMARELVGRALGVEPAGWPWREGPRGRPEIALDTPVRFNVAHSAGLVVCAVSHGRDVGVDVEHLDRRRVERELVARYCSPAEVADVAAHGADWHERFLTYWTLKEAYLKARGLGIAVPLAEITFEIDGATARIGFLGSLAGTDTRWRLELFRPAPRHLAAVCVEGAKGSDLELQHVVHQGDMLQFKI